MIEARLLSRLSNAVDFVEVATAICDEAAPCYGLQRCSVMLYGSDVAPVIVVDRLEPCEPGALDQASRVLPIFGVRSLVGSIEVESAGDSQHDLTILATRVAVRFAQLGIGPMPLTPEPLTSQQREVASRAARGFTNAEISEQLAISPNTVKKYLKEIFVRLDVTNRTELANVLASRPPPVDVPVGITRLPTVTVTRLR